MPITIFDSDTIPRDRRADLEAAVVAAGRHLSKLFEGWIVATPDRRGFAVRITSYPAVDISIPFEWNATAAERLPSECGRRWTTDAGSNQERCADPVLYPVLCVSTNMQKVRTSSMAALSFSRRQESRIPYP